MIYFFNLKPNDYNGFPELDVLFPDSKPNSGFPKIPTEEEVKHLFFEAGYSTYDMDDEIQQLGMDGYFQRFGNPPVYYAIYVIVVDEAIISSSGFSLRNHLGELITEMEYGVRLNGGPEALVKEMKDSPWVKEIFYFK